jgi:hypothetical protein
MAEPLITKLGQHWDFKNLEPVLIYNLDDSGKEYHGIIRGRSFENIIDSYIVELAEPINSNYPFDCVVLTEACLKSTDPERRPKERA